MDYALMHPGFLLLYTAQATFATMKQVLLVLYFALNVSALSNAFNGKWFLFSYFRHSLDVCSFFGILCIVIAKSYKQEKITT